MTATTTVPYPLEVQPLPAQKESFLKAILTHIEDGDRTFPLLRAADRPIIYSLLNDLNELTERREAEAQARDVTHLDQPECLAALPPRAGPNPGVRG